MPIISTEELFADSENTGARTISTEELFGDVPDEPQKSLSGFAKNAGRSLYRNTAGIVIEPIKEAWQAKSIKPLGDLPKSIFQLGGGIVEKALPDKIFGRSSLEDIPEAVAANYKQAYGGGKNIVNTLYEDPFRVAGDVSILAGGGAGLIKAGQASKIAQISRIANLPKVAKAANVALKVSEVANPMSVGLKATGKALQGVGKAINTPFAKKWTGRNLVSPDPVTAATKAIKPGKWNSKFPADTEVALPLIKQTGKEIKDMESFVEAAKTAKVNKWNEIKGLLKKAGGDNGGVSPQYDDILREAKMLRDNAVAEVSGTSEFMENFRNVTSGIKPYSKGANGKRFLAEELKSIPAKFKNANGQYLDEVVQSYNNTYGTEFTTNEFSRLLKEHGSIKTPSTNVKDYVGQASRNLSEYFGEGLLDGDDIAKQLRGAVKPESVKLTPEIGAAIDDTAAKYAKTPISIMEAENRLEQINAELTNYFKSSYRGAYVKSSQADINALLTERQVLKDSLYSKIESLTGENIAPLKKQYGALMNVQDEALGRINVANRQNPISLAEAIGGFVGLVKGNVAGLGIMGAAKLGKHLNSPNFLIKKAIENTGKVPFGVKTQNVGAGISKLGQYKTYAPLIKKNIPLKASVLGQVVKNMGR